MSCGIVTCHLVELHMSSDRVTDVICWNYRCQLQELLPKTLTVFISFVLDQDVSVFHICCMYIYIYTDWLQYHSDCHMTH